jgi:hypothetical protein
MLVVHTIAISLTGPDLVAAKADNPPEACSHNCNEESKEGRKETTFSSWKGQFRAKSGAPTPINLNSGIDIGTQRCSHGG